MTVNKCAVVLNTPPALKSQGSGANEIAHSLPPHRQRRAFLVDEYPACPEHWMRSSGRIKSYFVPVRENTGLWLDFNDCLHTLSTHVAVVVSAQGVNAITGLPCNDAALEQYRDECPKHKKAFGPDRLCTECGHVWPKQNYLASTGQPHGALWIDGFRAEDGVVRQYVFTANEVRSVAKAIIGKDRVFALGLSYFLSKQPRPQEPPSRGFGGIACAASGGNWGSVTYSAGPPTISNNASAFMSHTLGDSGPDMHCSTKGEMEKYSGDTIPTITGPAAKKRLLAASPNRFMKGMAEPIAVNAVQVKSLEIAAGAKIDQRIHDDPNDLDFWQKEPEGLIVVNYCTEEDAERIINSGKVDLSGNPEGFLQKVPVGNP